MNRLIEKNRTYRIPKADGTTELLQVVEMGKTLKMKNIKTGKIKNMDKASFVKRLNEGSIYVSAITKAQIKKQLIDAGIKIVKGNYVRKRDVELYLMEADWKEAIQKFKNIYQPLFKKLVSGILASGLFFGAMGTAKAEDFNKAQKSADKFAGVVQDIIDSKGYDLKAEAEAIKEGSLFRMKIKVTDVSDSEYKGNLCVIDLTKAGSDDNSFVDAKLKLNKDMDDFGIFHITLCKEIYNSWSKQLLSE